MANMGFGGMPTDVDVERLRQQIGIPQPGGEITYERISQVLNLERNTHRWQSVVAAWRKRLRRENNLVLMAIDNTGYRVLTSKERVGWVSNRISQARRRIVDGARVAVNTDRVGLDTDHCRSLDHAIALSGAWAVVEATERRRLIYPDPEVKRLASG